MQKEFEAVQELIEAGVNITHFQMGGEFWLAKYYFGKTGEKGVVEQVRIADYISMLDSWIPKCKQYFPDVKIMLLGCSHQSGGSQTEQYRQEWNEAVLNYKKEQGAKNELGFTVHYYAGAKPDLQPTNGEEAIFKGINWTPFISQLRSDDRNVEIIVPESGYYTSDKSQSQLRKMTEFYEAGARAVGKNGIMGLHVLNQRGESYHNWFDKNGITAVGNKFLEYFTESEEPVNDEPTLDFVVPDAKGEFVFLGITYLKFSDGSVEKIKTRFGNRPFGNEDVGKTKDELRELNK